MKAIKAALLGTVCAAPVVVLSATAEAQITFQTLQFQNSPSTGVTGMRGDNITGSYSFPGGTGGLLYRLSTGAFEPLPEATANGSNFPGAVSSQPYGPTFGNLGGILRVTGTFVPATGQPDHSYIFDSAAAPGQQYTTVVLPGAVNTIAHSQFGNLVVGNYNTTTALGSAFIYDASTGGFTTNNKPGAASTSAYGIWGNSIAGGYIDAGGGIGHAYIFNQSTGVFTQYDAPGGTIDTHFEGITAGGRAGEFNLIAGSTDLVGGSHAWAVHVDAAGVATWTEITVPGATSTSGNSIYEDKAIGIFVQGGIVRAYIATVPGLYNPVTNTGTLIASTNGATALSATNGDDVVNTGTIVASAPNSTGIASGTYGVIQNRGVVVASGVGSTAVQINGTLGSFINTGLVSATSGAFALATGPTAVAPTIVNAGIIDGQVAVAGGQFTRFQNSGWLGISAAGSGVTHTTSGVYAQTSTGILALRVGPTTSDSLQVTGAARLNGTAVANFQPGTLDKSYTLLTTTGGYTGTFSTLATQNLPAFLNASLSYGGSNVTLNLTSGFANTSGLGGDQISVGRALDSTFNAGGGLSAMPALFNLSSSQLPSALSQLSGDSASLSQTSAFAAGGQFTNLMTGRAATRRAEELAQAPCTKQEANACEPPTNWAVWGNGFAGTQWLNADSVTGAPASQASIAGGAFGVDYRFGPDTLVGLAVGLSDSNYWMPTNNATGRATGTHVGLYGTQNWAGFYLNAAIAYSRFDGNATRVVTGIGTTETERSSGVSSQLAGRIELGRPFNVSELTGGQVAVTPFVALQPAQLWTPGMTETSSAQSGGSGVFGLTYQPQATTSLPSFLGAQVDAQTEISGRPFNAWVRAAWVHEFLADRSVTAGFQVLSGTGFTVDGARAASDAARIDMGVKYAVGSQTSLFANGNVELSGRGQSLAGTIGLRFVW